MRILHLSDLHLDQNKNYEFNEFLKPALLQDVEEHHNFRKIDLVIISGDIVNQGGKSFGDITKGFRFFVDNFINDLNSILKLDIEKFILTIGNHDIEREKDDEMDEAGVLSKLNNVDAINAFIELNKIDRFEKIERIRSFKNFEKEFYSAVKCENLQTNFATNFILEIDKLKIGVSCLNSSWRCYSKSDKNNLIIGEKQIIEAKNFIKDTDIKIAVFHHPMDWLMELESKIIEPILTSEYNLVFNGHVHSADTRFINNFYGNVFVSIGSGTLSQGIRSDNGECRPGFTLLDYDLDDSTIMCKYRRYNHNQKKFVTNSDKGNDGISVFKMPSTDEIRRYNQKRTILNALKVEKINELNEHLITYGTETISPQKITELFVLPDIYDIPFVDDQSQKYEIFDLDSLLMSSDNVVIFGKKESGKTILIDRLMIELVMNDKFDRLPVFIDYEEIKNRELISFVRQYFLIDNELAKSFLEDNKIILFIDNISFAPEDIVKFKKISEFMSKYPNIKVISTSELFVQHLIPDDFFGYGSLKFKPLFIQQFEGKQIRKLIENWFINKKDANFRSNLEKLIDNYHQLAIPRTPMSVSIFLWIIERQELTAINYATMIENFVEGILEKFKGDEIFSETFDFKNKIKLLASIAKFVLFNGADGNSILKVDLQQFIYQYYEKRGMETLYDSNGILEYFIKKRLFVSASENRIKFKYPCFFEYLIAKQIEFDGEFADYILDEKRYLNFVNELNYYSGMNRGNEKLLAEIYKRFKKEFSVFDDFIVMDKIDEFFDNPGSIMHDLDLLKVKKEKPTQEEIDNYYDKQIKKLPVKEDIDKEVAEKKISLPKLLELMSYLLKNSEEVENLPLKIEIYNEIVRQSMIIIIVQKVSILFHIKEHGKKPDFIPDNFDLYFYIWMLPTINQVILNSWLGSMKLSPIILRKINDDKLNIGISDLEKFTSIFLYSDIKGANYLKEINEYIKKIRRNYIKDQSALKLLNYYYLRVENNPDLENKYLNMISDIKISVTKTDKSNKSAIMESMKKSKKRNKGKN